MRLGLVERAVGAAVCAALIIVPGPGHAAYLDQDLRESTARLDRAVSAAAETTRAVLRVQSAETLEPWADSVANLLLSTDAAELEKLVSVGIDAALSVPPDAADAATRGLRDALATSPDDSSCDLLPLPSSVLERIARADAVASADPTKLKALATQWEGVWKAAPKRAGGVCLPPPAAFVRAAKAQAAAVEAADAGRVRALGEQARATLGSVKKGQQFRLYSDYRQREMQVLGRASLPEREAFKKAKAELVASSELTEEIKRRRTAGPPKCFTVGCNANFEYDLWRYNSKDDYTGEGLEKPAAILSPKGLSKADLDQRAADFAAGKP